MNNFLSCSSLHSLKNKKKIIKIGPIDREIITKTIFSENTVRNLATFRKKNRFCIISRSIGPISTIFFLFCREHGELHDKKMFIEIELLDHEIIAKNDFFLFSHNLNSDFHCLL